MPGDWKLWNVRAPRRAEKINGLCAGMPAQAQNGAPAGRVFRISAAVWRGPVRIEHCLVSFSQLLAELHPPLIEGIDAPEPAQACRLVLVERNQGAEGGRLECWQVNQGDGPITRVMTLKSAFSVADGQRAGLGDRIGQERAVTMPGVGSGGIAFDEDEIDRVFDRSLMEGLEE
jgi:hypothetical protein